ncbi:hypothetical protein [Streptomyces sp. ID05-47C]|uniref:hypothetical protein n=1 Tax=Streptomyces sp. ID05-47C TaxID=3028665 RepID=UPI0029B755C9|nr:hypothetical protein [Streptomyces sp. ID05-47C]MDX3570809.1 hypothetical protein [Streptomyces sp. ID05-47C]
MSELSGDGREEMLAAGHAALAQLQYAHDVAVESVVTEVQQQTGVRLLTRRPGVLDASWDDLRRMSWQCSNFEAAVRLLRPLMANDGRPLGAVLKTADVLLVRDATRHLVEAGVLPSAGGDLCERP